MKLDFIALGDCRHHLQGTGKLSTCTIRCPHCGPEQLFLQGCTASSSCWSGDLSALNLARRISLQGVKLY